MMEEKKTFFFFNLWLVLGLLFVISSNCFLVDAGQVSYFSGFFGEEEDMEV